MLEGPEPSTLVEPVSAAELQDEALGRVTEYADWAAEPTGDGGMSPLEAAVPGADLLPTAAHAGQRARHVKARSGGVGARCPGPAVGDARSGGPRRSPGSVGAGRSASSPRDDRPHACIRRLRGEAKRWLCRSLIRNRREILRSRSNIACMRRAVSVVFLALAVHATTAAAAPRAEPVVVARIKVGLGPCLMEAAFGYVWVANNAGSTLTRVNPRTNRARGGLRVGDNPCGVAAGAGSIWIDGFGTGRIERVDPVKLKMVKRIKVGPTCGTSRSRSAPSGRRTTSTDSLAHRSREKQSRPDDQDRWPAGELRGRRRSAVDGLERPERHVRLSHRPGHEHGEAGRGRGHRARRPRNGRRPALERQPRQRGRSRGSTPTTNTVAAQVTVGSSRRAA